MGPSATYVEEVGPRPRPGAVVAASWDVFWSAVVFTATEEESRTGSKSGVSVANSLKRPLRLLRQPRGLAGPTRR